MALMNADDAITQVYDQLTPHLQGMAEQLNVTPDKRPIFDRYMVKMVDAMKEEMTWEKMEPHMIGVYVEIFSEDEIDELIVFYKSPLGQKLIDRMPEIAEASFLVTQEMMKGFYPRMREIQAELRAELQAN